MAQVVSVSVPDELFTRWKESNVEISPSTIFQTALETQLGGKGQLFAYWSKRALAAEKKLKTITKFVNASDQDIKRFRIFDDLSQ